MGNAHVSAASRPLLARGTAATSVRETASAGPAGHLAGLQRAVGNAAAQRWIARCRAEPDDDHASEAPCGCGANRIARQAADEGATAPPDGPAPAAGPTAAPAPPTGASAGGGQCTPFASLEEAETRQKRLLMLLIPALTGKFGAQDAALYESYLTRKPGAPLARRHFGDGSEMVEGVGDAEGYANAAVTVQHAQHIAARIREELPNRYGGAPPPMDELIRVESLLAPTELDEPVNWNNSKSIPGNTAGGVGSSDAGPDTRHVYGYIMFTRKTDAAGRTTGIRLQHTLRMRVRDAIDFCPGDLGNSDEQSVTLEMSRLEASGLAYDMPFEVDFGLRLPNEMVDLTLLMRWFPDARPWDSNDPVPPAPAPSPPPAEPGRPEDRVRDRD